MITEERRAGVTAFSLDTLVDEYIEHIECAERLARATVNNRRYILKPFVRALGISDPRTITPYDIDDYLINKCSSDMPSSLMAKKRAIRLFFQYCQEYKEINLRFDYSCLKIKKVKPPRVKGMKRDDVIRVIRNCKEQQDAVMIALMFETGMRIGELICLDVEDFNLNFIELRGKGEEDRIVCLTKDLGHILRTFLADRQRYSGRIFQPLQKHRNHPNDKYTSAYQVRDRIEREFLKGGIQMHPHQLRHGFSKDWISNGGDIRTLQVLLGHKNLETTQRYLHFDDPELVHNYSRIMTKTVFVR